MSSTSSPSLTRRPISLCNDLTRLNLIDVSWTEPEPPVDIRIPQSSSQDDDELERFRSEWRQEVQAKKGVNVGPVVWKEYNEEIIHNDSQPRPRPRPRAQQPTSPPAPLQWSPTSPVKTHDTLLPKDEPPDTERSHVESEPRLGLRTRKMDKARDPVQMYAKAVENEQSGRLSEALMLYRQAFKLDGEYLLCPCVYFHPRIHSHLCRLGRPVICSIKTCPRRTAYAKLLRCRLACRTH